MELEEDIILTDLDDRELVDRTLKGDLIAFDTLISRYKESIMQLYMQKTGGNTSDSDDMLQDTFIKVYLNIHMYNHYYNFNQWIFSIAKNTFIDFTRKQKNTFLSIDNQDSSYSKISPISSAPTPEEQLILIQHNSELEHILSRMPQRYREVIVLRFFNEYSYEEIAEKSQLPLGTVKTLIHRARRELLDQISSKDGKVF